MSYMDQTMDDDLHNHLYTILDDNMKAASSHNLEKYSAYKRTLVEEDSGSDNQPEQISNILCELIPAYYQYRKYLVDILKQANVSSSTIANYAYPTNYYEQRIKKCQQQQKLNEAKIVQGGSGHLSRALLTEKIIEKKRKQLQQHRQLMRKYEAQQIQQLIGPSYSQKQLLPKFQQKIDEQPTFQAKNFRRLSSMDYNAQPALNAQNAKNSVGSANKLYRQSPTNKRMQNVQNTPINARNKSTMKLVQYPVEVFSKKTRTQSDLSNSANESKVIQKSRNNNLNPIEAQSFYQDQIKQKAKVRKMSQPKRIEKVKSRFLKDDRRNSGSGKQNCSINQEIDDPTPLPRIRINYQSQKQGQYVDQQNSQGVQDQFLNVQQNKIINKANIVQVEHQNDDTYSQYRAKPYIRQNTPNFDAFSQQARPRNFFEVQKQKLLKQKQQVDQLHNQVSVVLGEGTQSFELNQKQIIRQSKQNFVLDQLLIDELQSGQVRNGKLSPRQSIQLFLSSIRYLLCELCDLNALSQCRKYLLKNKQYQILMNLCSEQIGNGPIFAKALIKKIEGLLKYQQKSLIDIVTNKIFNSQTYISFQEFGQAFYTKLTKNQYLILSTTFSKINPYEIAELLAKIFSVWLEINYFQNKIRKLFQTNSSQTDSLNQKITEDGKVLNYLALQKFVYNTSHNRLNSLKIQLFFNKVIPSNTYSEMQDWLQLRKVSK